MNERMLDVLEFNKVINQLKTHAATSLGKERCHQLTPSGEIDVVKQLQAETDEAMQIERLNKTIPMGGISDIRASLKRTAIGGVLSSGECLDVANTLYGSRQVSMFIDRIDED